jgi:hypothetical protein
MQIERSMTAFICLMNEPCTASINTEFQYSHENLQAWRTQSSNMIERRNHPTPIPIPPVCRHPSALREKQTDQVLSFVHEFFE